VVADDLFAAHYKLTYGANVAEFESARASVAGIFARFEETVRGPFFAGSELRLVDMAAAPILYRFRLLDAHSDLALFQAFPKVASWSRTLATRPSVVKGVLADFDERYLDGNRKRSSHLATQLR
jgi:glutathione S-transferase